MKHSRPPFAGYAALALALTAFGCDSKAPGADIVAKPSAPASPPAETEKTKTEPVQPKTDLDRSKLPANLQTDAYRYYGLSSSKPLDMEMTRTPDSGVLTGTVTYRMSQVDNSGATFVMDSTGGISDQLGNETLALKPDGLYSVSSDKVKLSKPQLELPTGLKAGKTWLVDYEVETEDKRKIRQKLTFTCKGTQDVKLGAKSYSALYVVGVGTVSEGKNTSQATIKEWLVKDIGTVKMEEYGQTPKGKPTKALEMVWKPNDSKAKS